MDADFIKKYMVRNYTPIVPEISIQDEYYAQEMRRDYIQKNSEVLNEEYAKEFLNEKYEIDPLYNLEKGKYMRRIDLLWLHRKEWTAIEIKVSRSDFFNDNYEKRKAWRNHTHKFVYLTPEGLVKPEEIPVGCGLWELDEYGKVNIKKRAKKNKNRQEFPESFLRTVFWRLATKPE